MSNNAFGRVALAVCILSAIAVSAQNQSYLLRSEGAVSVNGIAVPSSALVSDGDVIQTGKGGSAKIAAPGMAMLLGENSQRVAVSNGSLAINHGFASVSNTGRIATLASQYAIKPVGGTTRYLVSNYGGSLFITSESGGLAVTGPNMTSRNLPSGQKARFAAGDYDVFSAGDSESVQPTSFGQLIGSYTSNLCRTAARCYCKTAARCPNK